MLRFDPEVEGGESIFVDGFEVAKDLRKQFPDDFNNLVRIPATFEKIHFERYLFLLITTTKNIYRNNVTHYKLMSSLCCRDYPVKLVYKRPHIVLNPDNEVQ